MLERSPREDLSRIHKLPLALPYCTIPDWKQFLLSLLDQQNTLVSRKLSNTTHLQQESLNISIEGIIKGTVETEVVGL
jgi:hypothetical protein